MTITPAMTVGELASKFPHTTRILEKLQIDYCCGGARSLDEACRSAGISLDELTRAVEQAAAEATDERDYGALNQRDLVGHIIDTHHTFTRDELARIDGLLVKVTLVHGARHTELKSIQSRFRELLDDLMPHLLKEENVLFPYIVELEVAAERGQPGPRPPFVTVQNPVRMMMFEHDVAGEILRDLRRLSSDYTVPADGCSSYRALYAAMEQFEKDLHQHIHLESNILFPRAIEMEARAWDMKGQRCVS